MPNSQLLLTPFFPVLPALQPHGPSSPPFPRACQACAVWGWTPPALALTSMHLRPRALRHSPLFLPILAALMICLGFICVGLSAIFFSPNVSFVRQVFYFPPCPESVPHMQWVLGKCRLIWSSEGRTRPSPTTVQDNGDREMCIVIAVPGAEHARCCKKASK